MFREHVTYYILEHKSDFKTFSIEQDEDMHEWKWSIDTQEDLDWFKQLYKEAGFDPVTVTYKEVVKYVKAHRKRIPVCRGGVAQ